MVAPNQKLTRNVRRHENGQPLNEIISNLTLTLSDVHGVARSQIRKFLYFNFDYKLSTKNMISLQ